MKTTFAVKPDSENRRTSTSPAPSDKAAFHSKNGASAGIPMFLQCSQDLLYKPPDVQLQEEEEEEELQPKYESSTVQRQPTEEEEQGFQYSIIPPRLGYRHGPFSASADTSAAQLGYRSRTGTYNLGYQYGSDIFAGANVGGFQSRLGVNPMGGNISLGGSYGGFNVGLSGAPSGQFGARFGYGAPLLPMPAVLGQQAGAAWQGAYSLGGAIPEFGANPLAAYSAHSADIDAVTTFAGNASQMYQQQQGGGGLPFGVGQG
jgi:hypothetical protein